MFEALADYENDPIEAMFVRLMADTHADKIDLGIGVYRDEHGNAPVMKSVRLAEQQLLDRGLPKSYISPLGHQDYCSAMARIALGPDHAVLKEERIVSAQTPGAGSALRAAAELVHGISPKSRVWASQPVWGHQLGFFAKAGMAVSRYRYYDQANCTLQFAGMLEDLQAMQPGDLLLLHGCCHNPTGQDLDAAQWRAVADLVVDKGAIPFVDVAYQGFGEGIDEDVAGLRLLAERVPQLLLTVSSSKSFGIYRERAGLLAIILPPGSKHKTNVTRRLRDTVRELWFMAPDHGAATVNEILSTPALEAMWRAELDLIREHVIDMRAALQKTLSTTVAGFDASFLAAQHGMFSCLPISFAEQLFLEQEYHIYMLPPARVNVAAMSDRQSAVLAEAFGEVRNRRESPAQKAS